MTPTRPTVVRRAHPIFTKRGMQGIAPARGTIVKQIKPF